jgi:hypothetical protein
MFDSNVEDDLPHHSHCGEDTFDDLIPADERIERFITDQINGVNMLAYTGGIGNRIRCQSPAHSHLDVSILLDILD